MANCNYETDDETALYIEDDPDYDPNHIFVLRQPPAAASTPAGMKLLLIGDRHLNDDSDTISEMMESYINTYDDNINNNNNNDNTTTTIPPLEDPITDRPNSTVTKGTPQQPPTGSHRLQKNQHQQQLDFKITRILSQEEREQSDRMIHWSKVIKKWGICWMVLFIIAITVTGTVFMFRSYNSPLTTTSATSSSSNEQNNNIDGDGSIVFSTLSPSWTPSASPSTIPTYSPSSSPSKDIAEIEESESITSSAPTNVPTTTPVTATPTLVPSTATPSSSPSTELYSQIISIIRTASSTPEKFNDFNSYESKAAQWMKYNSTFPLSLTTDNEKIIQRYTLALLDIALHSKFTIALPSIDECEWFGVTCATSQISESATDSTSTSTGTSTSSSDLLLFQPVTAIVWNDQNMTTSQIPNDIVLLSKTMQHFDVSHNQIGGTIPYGLYSCTQLQYLYLHQNQMTGTIRTEMNQLSMLQKLFLNNNAFTGTIPVELGLSSLEWLIMYNNQLTGSIPSSLGWMNMFYLDLGRNQLTGTIPTEWVSDTSEYRMPRLNSLYLDHNMLNGTLPYAWYMLGNSTIEQIVINDNQLTGYVSSSRDYPNYNLTTFMAQNNLLTRIDKEFCKQHSIYEEGSGGMLALFNADCDICTCTDLCTTYCSEHQW